MKNQLNLTIIIVLACLLWLGCGGTKPDGSSGPSTTAKPVEASIVVTAPELTKEYDDNELAADEKYNGKPMSVVGKVSSIAETFGNVTVQLEGDKMTRTVMCSFEDEQKASVAKLKKGQQVTLTGVGDGMTAGLYVGLRKCRVGN